MHVLHVASEVAPHSKTGGLADVLGALPQALRRLGVRVTVVTPRYRSVNVAGLARTTVETQFGTIGAFSGEGIFFVDHPSFDRAGIYGEGAKDYEDNAFRFALLGAAAMALVPDADLLHGHDWQAGPALMFSKLPRLFTIHNLAYQGLFPASVVKELKLPEDLHHPGGYEFWGQVSFLKAGLVLADQITTVSPRYAREIQTAEQGYGLEGVLQERAQSLSGILNGCDYEVWNPSRDPHLAANYSAASLEGKRACKAALQRELELPEKPETPLSGSISRLVEQKGFDLVCEVLPTLLEGDMQYVLLGSGQPHIEKRLAALQAAYPDKLAVRIAYDEKLAHRIEAGCDLYVMPSRYEPCGLNQMYSLRYGTPPIVRATGGLDDTIVDGETGFKFQSYSAEALGEAWRRAILAYHSADFVKLIQHGMNQDFSWDASAKKYAELYLFLRNASKG